MRLRSCGAALIQVLKVIFVVFLQLNTPLDWWTLLNSCHTRRAEWNKCHPCLVATAIIWVAREPHDRYSRTIFASFSHEEWRTDCWSYTLRTIQGSLAFPKTWRASNLWSHWKKKLRKWYCVCTTCSKVTAYKEAWRFASAPGGNKCFPCIVAALK